MDAATVTGFDSVQLDEGLARFRDAFSEPEVFHLNIDLLLRNGALIQEKSDKTEIVVEARSGALSTDSAESLAGFPSMPVPIPTAGTLKTPEAPLFKASFQNSVAKLALTAYNKASGKHLFSADSLVGKARMAQATRLGGEPDRIV